MNPFKQFRDAGVGWFALIARQPGWRERFVLTREGLFAALGGYFAIVVVAILVQGIFAGVPSIVDLAVGIAVNGLPLVGTTVALWVTILTLRLKTPIIEMLVPVVHALTFVLIAGVILAFTGGPLATALLGMLGYMLYRAGREILGLNIALAIAYAALSIVMLVALPMSLYMLMAPGQGGPI